MALPIKATPTLKGKRALEFYKEALEASKSKKEELQLPDTTKIMKILKEKYKYI